MKCKEGVHKVLKGVFMKFKWGVHEVLKEVFMKFEGCVHEVLKEVLQVFDTGYKITMNQIRTKKLKYSLNLK